MAKRIPAIAIAASALDCMLQLLLPNLLIKQQ
jgi:hypothetical protein